MIWSDFKYIDVGRRYAQKRVNVTGNWRLESLFRSNIRFLSLYHTGNKRQRRPHGGNATVKQTVSTQKKNMQKSPSNPGGRTLRISPMFDIA